MKHLVLYAALGAVIVSGATGCGTTQQKSDASLRNTVVHVKVGKQPGMTAAQEKVFQGCVNELNAQLKKEHTASSSNSPLYQAQVVMMSEAQQADIEYTQKTAKRSMFTAFTPFGIGALFGKDKQSQEDELLKRRSAFQQQIGMCWSQRWSRQQAQQYAR